MKRRLDHKKLEQAAEVKFDSSQIAELDELVMIYAERFREPETPDFMLPDTDVIDHPRRVAMEARRAFVEAVEGVWREAFRRPGLGACYVEKDEIHDGPMIRLLMELFRAIDGEKLPSAATLYHDLRFIQTGRERPR